MSIHDYGKNRKRKIRKHGILNQGFFAPQYLVVPKTIDKEQVETIKFYIENELKKLAPNFKGFKQIIRYETTKEKSATHQVNEIKTSFEKQGVNSGACLFILPQFDEGYENKMRSLHDCLKNEFFPQIKFQCASEAQITSFFIGFPDEEKGWCYDVKNGIKGKFKSYLFNLALEYLMINRKWPYALEQNCDYDIYIGIDVHDRFAGFSFFYKNGEHIYFDFKRIPKKTGTKRAEKIKAASIKEILFEKLKEHIPRYLKESPNGIVVVRDGRSYGEEEKALNAVIGQLAEEGLVNQKKLKWGILDLHKESATPLRIVSETTGYYKMENPRTGVYSIINQEEGFLFNTGFPFEIPGTVKPIQLIYVSGNVNFESVMKDLFYQSLLAFSAPDRSNSLPICIKLIDNMLEPIANYNEESYEGEEIEDKKVEA